MEIFWGIGIAYLQSQNSLSPKKKKCSCVYVCVGAAQGQRRKGLLVRWFSLMSEPQANEKHCLRDTVSKNKVSST